MFGFQEDKETDILHKQATVFSKNGDLDSAILTLYRVKERMLISNVFYTIDQWTRLPKFLQKAGKFNDAIIELNFLIEDVERRHFHYGKGLSKDDIKKSINYDLYGIYHAMSLIYKREKLFQESEEYEKKAQKFYMLFSKQLKVILKKQHEKFINK
ncbi:MAG: hypothetical protein CJD30_03685 [Sulfuricurvum sp. PD_MW2]|uniref:hypothetical protein n=1 Tax=Sulfuricurvum sp. PD_MW2 TaxID=2027917 RepID=UPI000C06659C|nr:hypothetical protein [Sulfuricurvum sp. PD_MW2]PHM18074.1 MAG: hypothetical protein CJD30_03685 [Sulfuricurvum sp. PD_MW2]